jgi:hypothetical protein
MTRQELINEISERLAILSLGEDDLDFDFIVDQLSGLKGEIDALEIELDSAEPRLVKWLNAEHYKGTLLYVGAKTNYQKEITDGRSFPFDPQTRAALAARFNAWSVEALSRLRIYTPSDGSADTVKTWMRELDAFRADPTGTA